MNWCTYMVSCRKRAADREATLRSLAASDWGQAPVVVLDDEQAPTTVKRIARTWTRVMMMATRCDAGASSDRAEDMILMMEDDVRFTPRLRSIVEQWSALKARGVLFFGSLYDNLPSFYPNAGVDYAVCPPDLFWGFQAIVSNRQTLAAVLHLTTVCETHIDVCVGGSLSKLTPIYVHRPGLVTHVGVSTRDRYIGIDA